MRYTFFILFFFIVGCKVAAPVNPAMLNDKNAAIISLDSYLSSKKNFNDLQKKYISQKFVNFSVTLKMTSDEKLVVYYDETLLPEHFINLEVVNSKIKNVRNIDSDVIKKLILKKSKSNLVFFKDYLLYREFSQSSVNCKYYLFCNLPDNTDDHDVLVFSERVIRILEETRSLSNVLIITGNEKMINYIAVLNPNVGIIYNADSVTDLKNYFESLNTAVEMNQNKIIGVAADYKLFDDIVLKKNNQSDFKMIIMNIDNQETLQEYTAIKNAQIVFK